MRQDSWKTSDIAPSLVSAKKYLFVVNELGFIYSHFWALAQSIQDAGWEVAIAGAAVSDPTRALKAGMKFYEIRPTFGIGNPISEFRSFCELRSVIRLVRPDVIHTISLKNVLLGGVLARAESVPGVLSAITGLGTMFVEDRLRYRLLKPLVLRGLRHVHRHRNSVLALENTDDRKYFLDRGIVQSDRAVLIPGAGVPASAITPTLRRNQCPVILCVTRMIRNKGILYLIEAAKILRARGLQFNLQLVGDIDRRNPSSLTADELVNLQKEGIVNWLGKRSDVPDLLGAADIFCLPTYYREGMPRSLIEATAAGLPIVTTDVPGCREVVANEVNGLLVPPRDPYALADALARLIQSKELRERMGAAGRVRFEERFTTEQVLSAFNRCYEAMRLSLVLDTALVE